MFEGLKKLWHECKDAADAKWDAEHTIFMTPVSETTHKTTHVNLFPDIYKCPECGKTKPVVLAMNSDTYTMAQYQNWKSSCTKMCLKCYNKSGQRCPPPSFGDNDDSGTPIDTEIAALVAEMNRVGIKTICSCHGTDGEAYVSIRLGEGTTYNHRILGPCQEELTLKWRMK
jgi:hypothetical protein